ALLLSLAGMEICVSVAAQYIAEWPDLNWIELYGTQIKNYLLLLLLCLPMAYVPVWRLRRTSISSQITGRNERHVFRSIMMWLQLSIAVFFVGSVFYIQIVLHRTFDSYSPLSPEEEEQIIVFQPKSFYVRKNLEPMLNDFMALPEIIGKISTVQYPQTLYSIDWQNGKRNRKVEYVTGSPDYFDFLHIPLQGEKWVADVGDVVYVSERLNGALAKDSVPYSITLEGKPYRIAGVYKALYGESKDTVRMAGSVFFPSREYNYLYFRVAAGQNAQKVMDRLEKIYRTYIPETLPLEMRLLSDNKHTLNGSVAAIRVALVTLAFISLLLVILSIYSAISLDTTGRQKEVAIRKINGATPKAIAYLFGKSYFLIFMLAFLTGFPLACLLVNELSESGAPTIPAWQWGTLLFVFILSVVVLTVACKIRQVMQVNPAEVIKRE
ncbi:MAG: ABC transporter permease, partial [Bacteroides sp.]|nr:ABC transporter permease [Bacteroides sp.]